MKKALLLAGGLVVAADAALAQACGKPGCSVPVVPEISALEGTAALAAVLAVVALVWERRRRAS